MKTEWTLRFLQCGRTCTVAVLCLLVVEQPLLAASSRKSKAAPTSRTSAADALQGDDRIAQVLNRLTFGPRPGDLQAVKAMGLERWLDQQLHPQSMDDSALDARLAAFPAMQLSQQELVHKFPPNQLIRQVVDGQLPPPSDPVENAIYRNDAARYKENLAKLAQQAQPAAMQTPGGTRKTEGALASDRNADTARPGAAALPGDGVDPATPAVKTHEQQMYADLEATEVVNLPPDKRMVRLLAMPPDEYQKFVRGLPPEERADLVRDLTPPQRETVIALANPRQVVVGELMQSKLIRAVYSDRQLQEVMTDFWSNHFNVYIKKSQLEPYLLVSYERDVIRPNALGKFEDLLVATAQSPAMLMYLDNFTSIGPDSKAAEQAKKRAEFSGNPQAFSGNAQAKAAANLGLNENYARELMELHTLGVNGGYTQQDVTQVARVFTGWTIDRPYRQGGSFLFDERRHQPGSKTVLGRTIAEAGQREGLEVLQMLATSPATAHFISRELAIRFVADTPPEALVDRMADTWLQTDGDISSVLRTMINSPEFFSRTTYLAKMKTPMEYVVSAVRASGVDVINPQPLVASLDRLGMPLYGAQPPTGYYITADVWVNTNALVNRMNFALALANNRLPGVRTSWMQLLQQPGGNTTQVASVSGQPPIPPDQMQMTSSARESALERLLLGRVASDQTRQTVLKQLQESPTQSAAAKSFPITLNDGSQLPLAAAARQPQAPVTPQERQAASMAGLLLGSPEFQHR